MIGHILVPLRNILWIFSNFQIDHFRKCYIFVVNVISNRKNFMPKIKVLVLYKFFN